MGYRNDVGVASSPKTNVQAPGVNHEKSVSGENLKVTFTGVLDETDTDVTVDVMESVAKEDAAKDYPLEIVWGNVFKLTVLHAFFIVGMYNVVTGRVSGTHILAMIIYALFLNFGIAGGAHRLWAHKAFKAKPALKVLLIYLNTAAGQGSVYDWVRDHRMHHKFTETYADPYTVMRGYFFAHMGWVMCKKHPILKEKGKMIDMSDLQKDPMIMWQNRHFIVLYIICALLIPGTVFRMITGDTWLYIFTALLTRYTIGLHLTWLINSYAHAVGHRPYDKDVQATNSIFLGYLGFGEGFHNYHHVFPWDYKAAELNFYKGFNLTGLMIDACAMMGLAYDLKTVDQNMIKNRVLRTGDGTHHVWGWGDKDIPKPHIDATITLNGKPTHKMD